MENIGKATVALLLIIGAFFVSLLGAYVILKIGYMYNLSFVTEYSFIQIYGAMCIIGILMYRFTDIKKEKENQTFKKTLEKGFSRVLSIAGFYLISWLLAYLMYQIIS